MKIDKFLKDKKNKPYIYAGILILAFVMIGYFMTGGPAQIYDGTATSTEDSITLDNTGNLATVPQEISLQPALLPSDDDITQFDNMGGPVDIGNPLIVGNDDFSVSTWVYIKEDGSSKGLVYTNSMGYFGDYRFSMRRYHNYYKFEYRNESDIQYHIFEASEGGQYEHLVIVRDSSLMKFYIDSELISQFEIGDMVISEPGREWSFGGASDDPDHYDWASFNGKIEDFCIFDYALSDSQIHDMYNGKLPGNSVGHWVDGSYSGTLTIEDVSGNGHHGTAIDRDPSELWVISDRIKRSDTARPGFSLDSNRLEYEDMLPAQSTFKYSDGRAYVDSDDVTRQIDGSLEPITPDHSATMKIDAGLDYKVEYTPLSMQITAPDNLAAGQSLNIQTSAADPTGAKVSNQPTKMRYRLLDGSGDVLVDKEVGSTDFTIPGQYLNDGHRQLRMSYHGPQFAGWSNEIVLNWDVGGDGMFQITDTGQAPLNTGSIVEKAQGLLYKALNNWSKLDIPIISGISDWLIDTLELV